MFLLNSRIPLVRFSSELIVFRDEYSREALQHSNFNKTYPTLRQSNFHFHFHEEVPITQSSEPILFPKLRI
jgi:hypothetical protein